MRLNRYCSLNTQADSVTKDSNNNTVHNECTSNLCHGAQQPQTRANPRTILWTLCHRRIVFGTSKEMDEHTNGFIVRGHTGHECMLSLALNVHHKCTQISCSSQCGVQYSITVSRQVNGKGVQDYRCMHRYINSSYVQFN